MLRRLGTMMAATSLLLSTGGVSVAQEPSLLVPDRAEALAHVVEMIEPVRRDGTQPFRYGGIGVILTIDARGEVTGAEAAPLAEEEEEPPAPEAIAEALANARKGRFEPFVRDGVARPARVEIHVPLLPPERARSQQIPFPAAASRDAVIRLERTGCYGTCPIYAVEIRGDGAVTYAGEGFVAVEGVHRGQVTPEAVAALVAQFREADFFSLDDEYVAGVTDNPTQIVTLTLGGRTKQVIDYVGLEDGMPFAVERLEHAIDRTAETRAWVQGDATTAGRLEAEGYDFTSVAAGEALVWMAWDGSEEAALDFAARGAPLQPGAGDGFGGRGPALDGAASKGRARLARALIAAGALERAGAAETALAAAARSRDLPTLEVVLGAAEFDRRRLGRALTAALNEGGWGSPERDPGPVVDRLLALNPDVNVADGEGRTPLHAADTPERVRQLLALGADLEAKDEYGGTALTNSYDEDVILALIDAGADVTVEPEYTGGVRETATRYNMTRVLARLDAGS